MDDIAQYKVDVQSDESALQALVRQSGLPADLISDAALKGAVWVSWQRGRGRTRPQRLYTLSTAVAQGSTLMLNYNPRVLASAPYPMRRVSDHINYSIWFKPSGMLCQGSKWSDHTVATQVAAGMCDRHCFLVHRLDRAASGLLLIAHTKNSLRRLSDLFQQRLITKFYSARVSGLFTNSLPLLIDKPVDEREARTTVHSAEPHTSTCSSTLRLSISTGRKHQIRKHLAACGHPIIGDRLYGAKGTVFQEHINLQLVACALEFECPFSKEKISTSINANDVFSAAVLP